MDYVQVLAALLAVYLVGAFTRQMTTVLTMALIAAVLMPSPGLVVQTALLHVVFFAISKYFRLW